VRIRKQNQQVLQPQYDARINRAREEKIPFADEQTRVRVYTPNGSSPFPGHLYIHGGAFWLLHAHHFDKVCQDGAARARCVVASVDYGLAPEVRCTQVKQCYAALCWMTEHAADLGIDAARISIEGESAGGNLAAATTLMVRDRDGPKIIFQVLVDPELDMALIFPSVQEFGHGWGMESSDLKEANKLYFRNIEDATTKYGSPLYAEDLSNLPPALIFTAECDPLRDAGEAYGRRLWDAGVEASVLRCVGHPHGAGKFSTLTTAAYQRTLKIAALLQAYGVEALKPLE
jgi:acetyl esterase